MFAITAVAQTINVRGVVLQASDQEPIPGATVKAKGTTIGTQTDVNGEFRLTIPASVKFLDVSFIGMFPVEVEVKPNLTI